jgi:hypothetical protein
MKKDELCNSVCEFDGETGWYVGCGRTIPEIRAWRKMAPCRRTLLTRELMRRDEQVNSLAFLRVVGEGVHRAGGCPKGCASTNDRNTDRTTACYTDWDGPPDHLGPLTAKVTP